MYVIGESGIEEELRNEGVQYFGGTDPEERVQMQEEDYTNFVPDPEVNCYFFCEWFSSVINDSPLSRLV